MQRILCFVFSAITGMSLFLSFVRAGLEYAGRAKEDIGTGLARNLYPSASDALMMNTFFE